MKDYFVPVTDAERERLVLALEEMAEASKVIAKVLRHGWAPVFKGVRYDNQADLEAEMGDVRAAFIRLGNANDVRIARIEQRVADKLLPGHTLLRYQTENRGEQHPDRRFTGEPRRWCSRCPFPEGCVSCDLP